MNLISKFCSCSRALQFTKPTWHHTKTHLKNILHPCQSPAASSSVKNSSTFSSYYSSSLPESYYNEKQKEIQQTTAKLIETEIKPFAEEWDLQEEFPSHNLIKRFGNAGLLGIRFDPKYGGSGLDYKYQAAYLEEMGTISCVGVGAGIIGHTEITLPALARFGSDSLRSQFLAPSISGDVVSCLGVSEPQAGSDVANIKTSAVRKGDDLIINGQKMWITNGLKADWICLLANTSQSSALHKNKSLICVPMDSPGITKSKIRKIGWKASDTAQIFFENVRVPASFIIGDEGSGFLYQMLQFQEERLGLVLCSLRALDKGLNDTIEYTNRRKVFKKSILDNQVVHFRLAELATEVEALRALTYQAVDMMVNGEDVTRLASMAKLKVGRLLRTLPDACLQYWGGVGYKSESFISRLWLDGRLASIGGGADEIMMEIITKLMGIAPSQHNKAK